MFTVESPFYFHLNQIMRENNKVEIEKMKDFIFYLTEAISKLPKYSGSVFRGIDATLDNYKPGKVVTWQAFSSSSCLAKVAMEFVKGAKGKIFFPFLTILK
jgi:hypothetical protein